MELKKLKLKIVLVDAHPILREAFADFINREPDLQVCSQTGNATTALAEIKAVNPNLVLVDIALNGGTGINLIKQIKRDCPEAFILAFSDQDEILYAERALRAGARGYVMKQAPTDEVMAAIRKVARGARYLSRNMQERMLENFGSSNGGPSPGMACLSDRELEVFKMIGNGSSSREIAEQLHLSIKTVETYRAHIKEKLGLRNGVQLVHMAVQNLRDGGRFA